ncbi:MAG: hypothetical protein QOE70_4743 [Chthoniobacter sp.]|jgi:hypothetical protein|nr:hypothetical protein [Chthoniobacter sp.]
MTALYNEIRERFPEVSDRVFAGDEELPYMLMHHLADWLKELPAGGITSSITSRVVAFCRWCEQQPRGEQAADDLYTILVVGFYESLFKSASTRVLLPKVLPPEDIAANAEYLRTWVGKDNYNEALKQYRPNG